MAKPEWGTKRICLSCGARFYDFARSPISCPACGSVFDLETIARTRRSRPMPRAEADEVEDQVVSDAVAEDEDVAEAEEVEDEDAEVADETVLEDTTADEDEDEEAAIIEDTGDLGDDDEDVSDVIDEDLDEDSDDHR